MPPNTETSKRPELNVTLTTKYVADSWHFTQPTQSATTETIGQCVAIQEHPPQAGKSWKIQTIKRQSTHTTDQNETEKGMVTAQNDL